MRTGIIIEVSAAYRIRLEAVLVDRNSPQKHVWRARIALVSAGARHPRDHAGDRARPKPVCGRWQAAAASHRHGGRTGIDGGPLIIAEFVAHDSRLRFRSLNHVRRGAANALNLLPLSAT